MKWLLRIHGSGVSEGAVDTNIFYQTITGFATVKLFCSDIFDKMKFNKG